MKHRHRLFLGLAFTLTAANAATTLSIDFPDNLPMPKNTTAIIPGLFLKYSNNQSQLLLFDDGSTPTQRTVSVPSNLDTIKPILVFEENSSVRRYWYCETEQKIQNLDPANPHLTIHVTKLPESSIPPNGQQQSLGCSYQPPLPEQVVEATKPANDTDKSVAEGNKADAAQPVNALETETKSPKMVNVIEKPHSPVKAAKPATSAKVKKESK